MYSCILCKQPKSKGQRFYYGFVCKDCKKSLPNLFPIKNLSEEQAVWFYENKKDNFSETAKLGALSIDEPHALFCVHKAFTDNVFSFMDLSEISLEPTNVRQSPNGNEVFCDIEFQFALRKCSLRYKGIVKQHEKCNVEINGNKLSVKEPLTLGMMRSMIGQSIENQYNNGKLILEKLTELEEKKDYFNALSTLMLSEGFTEDELKKHRNFLVKAFHPDNNADELSTEFTEKVNQAYKILKGK